ncbi:MAG: ABC transporter permease [Ktedonobacteraceae bacterium]
MSVPTSSQHTPSSDDNERTPSVEQGTSAGTMATSSSDTNAVAVLTSGVAGTGIIAAPLPGAGAPATQAMLFAGRLRDVWRLVTLNRKVTIGVSIIGIFVLIALFGPLLVHGDPNALGPDTLEGPSPTHWFGTTQTGQDVFTQLIDGTRTSLILGFVIGILATALSVLVGMTAGYFGGAIDDTLSLVTNVFLVLPAFPLAVVMASYFPFKGPLQLAIIITITGWAWGARVLRAQTLSMRQRDFVEAARATGESTWRIIFYEILPNEIAIIAASLLGTVTYAILAEIGFEFLGLGDVTIPSWGVMLFWAQNNDALLLGAWWWFVPPGLCAALVGAALAFINFGIDEAANPRLRREPKPRVAKAKRIAHVEKEGVA